MIFKRNYNLSLNRVHDTVRVVEGPDRLELRVDGDAMRMVAGLSQAQKRLQALDGDSTDEQQRDAALYFAGVMFGAEQAGALMDFYRGDAGCVIGVCGRYFSERLSKLIAQAQKKAKL